MHLLWLKSELLHPVDKGGRIRTYQMLRALTREHRVTYLCLDDGRAAPDAVARAGEYCSELVRVPFQTADRRSPRFFAELAANVVSPLPYALAKYRVPAFTHEVERLMTAPVDAVVCDFLTPAVNLRWPVPRPMVLFQHNVEAEIWRRHAEVAANPLARAYFRSQWRRMVAFESRACRRVDHVVAVSEQDAGHFRQRYGARSVSSVATGVDTDFFHPAEPRARRPHELVFTGAMDWMPNEDGMQFFVADIWPRVRASIPDATLTIVGRNPAGRLRELAAPASGIEVTGSVPDVRPYMDRAALFVVPLRIGGGTRLKVFEAMAMECPVVSTAIGAEGLPVQDGEHFCSADEPEAFAQACIALLRDPARAAAMARRAARYVRSEFGWDRVAAAFAERCAATLPLKLEAS